jgi:hypothetical protein
VARDLEELRSVVSLAIQQNLKLDVKSVKVTSEPSEDGDEVLFVELVIELTPRRLPKDIMYTLVKSAAGAIRGQGEDRMPVIMPHLAEKQLLAARS